MIRRVMGDGRRVVLYVMLLLLLMMVRTGSGYRPAAENNNCPAEQEILPCQCRNRGRSVLLSCRRSTLEELTLIFEVMSRRVSMVEELMLEENDLSELRPDLFRGQLMVRRLLLWNNGLERVTDGALDSLGAHLKELSLREPRLSELPEGTLDSMVQLEKLMIEHTPLTRLPRLMFCQSLLAIHLDETRLSRLDTHALFDLRNLVAVQMTNSYISDLADQAFSTLPRLEFLNLTGNWLTTMKRGLLHLLPQLTVVDLRSNAFTDIHSVLDALRPFNNLQTLHLDHNKISSLQMGQDVVSFPKLTVLTLSHNRISDVVSAPYQSWPLLRFLDLSFNEISSVPSSFLSRTRLLEDLNLAGNPIVPQELNFRQVLSGLPHLRSLNLDQCGIEQISQQSFGFHYALEYLSLRNNAMRNIEAHSFHGLPALTVLNLKQNQLSNLPRNPRQHWNDLVPSMAALSGVFWDLPALHSLDLSENQLEEIDSTFFSALPALRALDLKLNGLTRIDPRIWSQMPRLELLDLSRNSLDVLDERICQQLPNLERMNVSSNQLSRIGLRAFRCPNLRTLDVSHNTLTDFSDDAFDQRNSIQFLDLSHNILDSIPNLRHLGFLRTLNLASNWIDRLRESDFEGNLLLENLNMSRNQLRKLPPESFSRAHHLRTVDLSRNRIELLTADVFRNLLNLDKLDLSFNRISDIEGDAWNPSTSIRCLNLGYNNLTYLSTDGINLDDLQILNLRNNQIEDLSYFSIHKLRSLSELDLSNNAITSVQPKSFENSRALLKLDLSNNRIEQLPSSTFSSLPNLQSLSLARNRIQRVDSAAFYDLVSLESLELEENAIQRVDPEAFHGPSLLRSLNLSANSIDRAEDSGISNLLSLEILDLSHNRINELDGRSFRRLVRLVELNLDNNTLCRMAENSLQNQRKLRSLSLRHNHLAFISESALQNPQALRRLDMEGNPLQCDCRMLWLYERNESLVKRPTSSQFMEHRASRLRFDENSWEFAPSEHVHSCFGPTGRLSRSVCQSRTLPTSPVVDSCPPNLRSTSSESPETTTTTTTTTTTVSLPAENKQPDILPDTVNNAGKVETVYAEIRKRNNTQTEKTDPGGALTPLKLGLNFLPAIIGVGSLVSGLFGRHAQQSGRPNQVEKEPNFQYDYVDEDLIKPTRGPDPSKPWIIPAEEDEGSAEYPDDFAFPITTTKKASFPIFQQPNPGTNQQDRPYIPLHFNPPRTIQSPSQPVVFVDDDYGTTPSYDKGHWFPTEPPTFPTTTSPPSSTTTLSTSTTTETRTSPPTFPTTSPPPQMPTFNISEDGFLYEPSQTTAPTPLQDPDQEDPTGILSLHSLLSLFRVRPKGSNVTSTTPSNAPKETTPLPITTTKSAVRINATSTEVPRKELQFIGTPQRNDSLKGTTEIPVKSIVPHRNDVVIPPTVNETNWITTLYDIVDPDIIVAVVEEADDASSSAGSVQHVPQHSVMLHLVIFPLFTLILSTKRTI